MKSKIISLIMVCITIATVYYALLYFNNFRNFIISQTQQQLLDTAKATVKGMEEYIKGYSDSLKVIAQNPSFQKKVYKKFKQDKKKKGGYYRLRDFHRVHENNITMVSALDSDGSVLHCYPTDNELIGKSYRNDPGVNYVLKMRRAYVSEAFTRNNQICLYILEPVFFRKEFAGIVRCTIPVDALFNRFIPAVIKGGQRNVWIFDNKKNIIIAHNKKNNIGKSVEDIIQCKASGDGLKNNKKIKENKKSEAALKTDVNVTKGIKAIFEKKYQYLPKIKDNDEGYGIFMNHQMHKARIMAFKRFEAGRRNWKLIISNDYSEKIQPIEKFARNIFVPVLLLLLFFMNRLSSFLKERMGIY
ncbi:MAG: cache domain-containing protein [bacterium]